MAIRICPDVLRRQRDLLLWVEVKHGADISGDQLVEYQRLLPQEPAAHRLLVILAPAQRPPKQDTRGLPVVLWQDLLTRCAQRTARGPTGSAHRLIFDEFYEYCAQEELMPATPLTVHSAAALAGRRQAARTAEALCQLCHEAVLGRFEYDGARGGSKQPQYGTSFWAKHRLPRHEGATEAIAAWQNAWLEWGLRHDHSIGEQSRDAFAFVAGVTFQKSQTPPPVQHPEWLARLLDLGFLHVRHDGYERLWSYRYPESLLAHSTLEEQGAELGRWVIERFDTLAANPPSRGETAAGR